MTSLGTGKSRVTTRSSVLVGGAGPSADGLGDVLVAVGEGIGVARVVPRTRSPSSWVTRPIGWRASSSSQRSSGSCSAGTTRHAGGSARGQADDGGLVVGHLEGDEPSGVAHPPGEVGQLVVQSTGEQRADPAAARGEGHGLGGVTVTEALGIDQPGHVDPGVRPTAGGDGEGDLVHGGYAWAAARQSAS